VDLRGNFRGRQGGVEHPDAGSLPGGQFQIAAANGFKKNLGFAFDAVGALVASAHAGQGGGAVQIEEKGHGGEKSADGEMVDPGGFLRRDFSGDSLVDGCGIQKAVGDHDAPGFQGRADDFPHELGAAGGEEKEFGFRGEGLSFRRMLKEVTDHFPGRCPPGFAHQQGIMPQGTQGFRKEADLS